MKKDTNLNKNNYFFIKKDFSLIKIFEQDIFYLEAKRSYITIHTKGRKYNVYTRLKNFVAQLPASDFAQVHYSYVVRLDKISVINNDNCVVNKEIIPISRNSKKKLLNKIKIITNN